MSDAKPDWENFSKAVLADWPTGDLEGSVLFDLSLQYGMIKEVPGGYNSDHHFDNDGICPEEGDPWYEYTFGGEAGPGLYSIAEMKNTIAALRKERDELREELLNLNKQSISKQAELQRKLTAAPDLAELVEALRTYRNVTPGAMVALMTLGRDGLLLADNLHKADDAARAALAKIKEPQT